MGIGMHMIQLRRIRAGIFYEKDSIPLQEFEKINEKSLGEKIIPGEIVSEIYKPVEIKEEAKDKVLHGKPIFPGDLLEKNNLEAGKIISVFSGNQFIGMFKVVNEDKILAKPEFVFQPV